MLGLFELGCGHVSGLFIVVAETADVRLAKF